LELKKKVIVGFSLFFAANLFSKSLQFISKIVLAWFLLPKDFGLFAIGFLLISILEVFRSSGLEQSLIYTKKNLTKATNAIFFMQMAISFALFAIVFLISGFAGEFFGKSALEAAEITAIIQALSFMLIINSIGAVHSALLEKTMDFKKRVLPEVVSSTVYFAAAIFLAISGFGVWSLVVATIVSNILYNLAMLLLSPIRISLTIDFALGKELLDYAKFVFATSLMVFVLANLDVAVIGRMLSAEMLGFYSMATTIAVLLPMQLSFTISKVMFPAYSLISEQKEALKAAYVKLIKYVFLFFLPLALGTILLAPMFVSVVLGQKWENPELIAAMQILAVLGFARAIGSASTPIFMATGKPKILTIGAIMQLAMLAITIVPATEAMGIVGASLAITISSIIIVVYFVCCTSKILGFKKSLLFHSTEKIVVAGLAMSALIAIFKSIILNGSNWQNFVFLCVIAVFSFLMFIFILEKETIIGIFREISPAKK